MLKEQLIREVALESGRHYTDVDAVVQGLVSVIWRCMRIGEEVKIRELGNFYVKYLPSGGGYDFKTNTVYEKPARNKIRFEFSEQNKKRAEKVLNSAYNRGELNWWGNEEDDEPEAARHDEASDGLQE